MRDVKFCVRNEKTGEILAYEKLTESGWVWCYPDGHNRWANGVFDLELMGAGYLDGMIRCQSTGIKDKNGVDIYENDEVKGKHTTYVTDQTGTEAFTSEWQGYVKWQANGLRFVVQENDIRGHNMIDSHEYEVISTIHTKGETV